MTFVFHSQALPVSDIEVSAVGDTHSLVGELCYPDKRMKLALSAAATTMLVVFIGTRLRLALSSLALATHMECRELQQSRNFPQVVNCGLERFCLAEL